VTLGFLDPFLLLDHFGSDNPVDYMAGFPWHPHRGIETVTYMLNGELEHSDSLGNKGVIRSGGIHWTTAGNGVIHQEMRFLFVAGKPLNEPIEWRGQIVMNSKEELYQAFEEYHGGAFVKNQ